MSKKQSKLALFFSSLSYDEKKLPDKEDLPSALKISDDAKAQVLIESITIYHNNIGDLTARAYMIATWFAGAEFAALVYIIGGRMVSHLCLFCISAMLLFAGTLVFLCLRTLYQDVAGNRRAIMKCEAALDMYETGAYLSKRSLYTFRISMLHSPTIARIIVMHVCVTIVCASIILLGPKLVDNPNATKANDPPSLIEDITNR